MNAAIIILVFTAAAIFGTRRAGRANGWDRPPCSEHDDTAQQDAAERERIRQIVQRQVSMARDRHEWWNLN